MQAGHRVALYVRVSSEAQVDGYSLDAQEAVLKEDVKKRGKQVYKVYRDEGISGIREDRKALNQMLKDARSNCFSEVLVWTVSRVSRKLSYFLKVIEELRHLGIAFRSLTERFDAETPLGQFSLTMMAAVAQMQRESWMESSRIGMEKRVKSGRHNGVRLLGYQSVPDGDDLRGGTKLVIVPEEAETVRQIFSLYAAGLGYKAIVNRLNTEGKTSKNGKPFSISAMQLILSNPFYIGKVRFVDLLEDGIHEAIVSQEVWDAVQAKLATRVKPVEKKIDYEYMLSGILRCPACGSGMIPMHTKSRRKDGSFRVNYYYQCGAYLNRGKSACQANSIRAIEADEKVLTWLADILGNPFWRKMVWEAVKQRQDTHTSPAIARRKQAAASLAEIAKQQRTLLQQYEDGVVDKDLFLQEMHLMKMAKAESQTVLDACEKLPSIERELTIEDIKAAFQNFRQVLKQASQNRKRELIRALIARVTVNDRREVAQMELKLPLPPVEGQEAATVLLPFQQAN